MSELLKGAPVAGKLRERAAEGAARLREKGIIPKLAIVRAGDRDSDDSYERGALKRCAEAGIEVDRIRFPGDADGKTFLDCIRGLNADPAVHGILVMMPLPKQISEQAVREILAPEKDVDGCTAGSLAGVFMNEKRGFPPCTAQAAMEILDYYGISCAGKKAAVAGRSLVVGRPAAMMLMHRNATVTVCHSRTENLAEVLREADILIACTGKMEMIGKEAFREGQTIIDVGVHWNEAKQKLCGDVRTAEAEAVADAVTPVPGGVGAVTSSVLALHVVEAAERLSEEKAEY